jgi:ABC-type bacteriocin/lantibiotic exporter with double-glycine peptidase domain
MIRELLTTSTLSAILDGAMVSVYLVLLVGASPRLAAVALVLAAIQVVVYLVAGKKNRVLVMEGLASQARLEAYQVEMLSAWRRSSRWARPIAPATAGATCTSTC